MTLPTPRFQNDDEAGQHWIGVLQRGDPTQAVTARTELAGVFERRGMITEAVDLLEGVARSGAADPLLYTRLAEHYRTLGRQADSDAAMAHASTLIARQQQPVQPQPVYQQPPVQYYPQPPAPVQNVVVNNIVSAGQQSGQHPPMIIRMLYFLFIGWWFGFLWIGLALATFPFVVTIPLGIWMLNRTGRAFFL